MSDAAKKRRSFSMAYLLAQCGPVVSFPEKQPTAYSYNGVVLPDIYTVYTPELQKEFPFVMVVQDGVSNDGTPYYHLYVCTGRVGLGANPNYPNRYAWAEESTMRVGDARDGAWVLNAKTYSYKTTATIGSSPKWANYDILDSAGNIHLPASEPVPVYE